MPDAVRHELDLTLKTHKFNKEVQHLGGYDNLSVYEKAI